MAPTTVFEYQSENASSQHIAHEIDPQLRTRFVEAMGLNATSVNVITTAGKSGRFGLTVSAFNSVSADPPTLLVCINRRSPACGAILRNEKFAVNILNRAQRHISDTFAGRPTYGEAFDFSCCEWADGITGIPVIKDAVASFECQVEAVHDIGSHTVFIGRAVAVEKSDQQPLMYSRRGYSHLSP